MGFVKLTLKASGTQPVYRQLMAALESAIERGELATGERLPSERGLAAQLKVSRTTVATAYRELESRGIIRSQVGRGTFVCAAPDSSDAPFAWRGKVSAGALHLGEEGGMRHLIGGASDSNIISFAAGTPSIECFPMDDYARLTAQSLKRYASAALGLAPTEGQPRLRAAIAHRFKMKPERILILSGAQQGLNLIARCLLDPGDAIIVDRPGYVGAIQTFRAAGAKLIGWDVMRADLAELEDLILRYRPKFLYTSPTFQNPTAKTLALRERQELLRLATRYRIPVIEDDPYRETYLAAPPPPSLYELDKHNIVIHLSTFSKILAPGLRLGWLAASEYVVDQLASIKQRENLFTEGLGQLIMAELLRSGLFDEHLIALRAEHAKKRSAMSKALERHLPKVLSFSYPQGGLYMWCRMHSQVEARHLLQQALLKGVSFANGEMFYPDRAGRHELRLCFTGVPVSKIEEGVEQLRNVMVAGRASNLTMSRPTLLTTNKERGAKR